MGGGTTARLRLWARWLLDGRYRWGYAVARTGRYGTQSIGVHIFAPGTSPKLRRCAHLARMWTPVSAAGTIAAAPVIVAVADVSVAVAGGGPLALFVATGIALRRASAATRAHAVSAYARRRVSEASTPIDSRFDEVALTIQRLHAAEEGRDDGSVSVRAYLALWNTEFERLT
ncbi:hypothetical protein MN032_03115 [Agromyces atrinae]|uniref:DUF6611 family protein n=1 Tax=Agromyces atrinae TaxID=592376 RepID=UPI001F57683B|nr:DUF6611 family protein [Agromyces atrinae]MCI2956673.1 hypothetical protein [Agromyces atrinae]